MNTKIISLLACSAAFLSPVISLAQAPSFGNAPANETSQELAKKVYATYKSGGMAEAKKMLDGECLTYVRSHNALAQFDFFAMLKGLATFSSEREDPIWSAGIVEWLYGYSRFAGNNYWYRNTLPHMYKALVSAGRYGAAREVINFEFNRVAEAYDSEMDIDKFKSTGPIMKDFPEILRREPKTQQNWRDVDFLSHAASLDLAEGKWVRAMEQSSLTRRHAEGNINWYAQRPTLQDSKIMIDQLMGLWRFSREVEAEIWDFVGLPELELRAHEEVAKFKASDGNARHYVLISKCRNLQLRFLLGKADVSVTKEFQRIQDKLKEMNEVVADDVKEISLFMADVLLRSDRAVEGWVILDAMRNDAASSEQSRFRANREWCRHRVIAGKLDDVEPQLLALLEIARAGGIKREEIDLYRIYSDFLVASGRYSDALRIQGELIRLLKAFNVYPRLPEAMYGLAKIKALMGQKQSADDAFAAARQKLDELKLPAESIERIRSIISTPLPTIIQKEDTVTVAVDLQPRRSLMVPLAGLPARGLFSLSNPSGKALSGKLMLEGENLSASYDANAAQVIVQVGGDKGKAKVEQPLALTPGSSILVDLSSEMNQIDASKSVKLEWHPEDGSNKQTAVWNTDMPEDGVSVAVTDASEYLDNAFYLIPVYHLMQFKGEYDEAVDFRIEASQPSRVEMYDQGDQLVFVDADGDGVFKTKGDLIGQDMNRNGEPDLHFAVKENERRFMLYIRPQAPLKGKDLELKIQVKIQGEWQTHSIDRIVANP
jgi:hypothetical protein